MIFTANSTITIKRLVEVSGEKSYTNTIATGIKVHIEPLSDDILTDTDSMGYAEGFMLYTNYDIQTGDKLTDQDAIDYKVRGVKNYKSLIDNHNECIIQTVYD